MPENTGIRLDSVTGELFFGETRITDTRIRDGRIVLPNNWQINMLNRIIYDPAGDVRNPYQAEIGEFAQIIDERYILLTYLSADGEPLHALVDTLHREIHVQGDYLIHLSSSGPSSISTNNGDRIPIGGNRNVNLITGVVANNPVGDLYNGMAYDPVKEEM